MIQFIKRAFNWICDNPIFNSLKMAEGGWSFKKEVCIVLLLGYLKLHQSTDQVVLITLIYSDAALIAAIIGISTYQQINKKNENNTPGS